MEQIAMSELWEVVTAKTQDDWLQLRDPEGWRDAYVKWDGCIGYTRHFNQPNGDGDSDDIHICDLDDEIARLQALKELALKHFGANWPNI